MHCKDFIDLLGIPRDSFGWLTVYLDHEVSRYVQFLMHGQYNSLQACFYRLMRNKLKWGFCLEPPEVFVNLHHNAKAVTIIGPCGSIFISENDARLDVKWLLTIPLNMDFNLTFVKFNLH